MNILERLEHQYLLALAELKGATTEEQKRALTWQVANAWQSLEECKAMQLHANGLPESTPP